MIPQNLQSSYQQHLDDQVSSVKKVLSQSQFDHLLIAGGTLNYRFRDDTTYPFRLNPYLARFAPLQHFPNSWLLISADQLKPKLWLYEPQDFWHKVETLDCTTISEAFDIEVTTTKPDLAKQLNAISGRIAALGDASEFEALDIEITINPESVLNVLDYHCGKKSEYEIACLSHANKLGAAAHCAARDAFFDGASEYQAHQAFLSAIDAEDHQLPYDSIVAINQNSAILHYTFRERQKPQPSHSMLIDAGASFLGYGSDITRTYCRDSNHLFSDLVRALDDIQQKIIALIKPGVDYLELHVKTHAEITQLLCDSQIIQCSVDEASQHGLSRTFFPHGLGHFLGIQVHDKGGWFRDESGAERQPPKEHPFLRLTRTLEQGHVVTIEPGLYFIPMLLKQLKSSSAEQLINWKLVEQLTPFGGIRIEDNVLVTDQGARNLTREFLAY